MKMSFGGVNSKGRVEVVETNGEHKCHQTV